MHAVCLAARVVNGGTNCTISAVKRLAHKSARELESNTDSVRSSQSAVSTFIRGATPQGASDVWRFMTSNPPNYKKPVVRAPLERKGFRVPEGVSSISNEDELRRELKEKIWKAQINKNPTKLLQCVAMARHNRMELDVKEYNAALWACSQITDDRNVEAYWIYALLKKHTPVPMSVFHNVMKVCLLQDDSAMALKVIKDYEILGYEMSEPLMCDLLRCLSWGKGSENSAELLHYYGMFRKLSREKGWQGVSIMYLDVLQSHMRLGDTHHVLEVLRDMTDNNFEPSLELCYNLLNVAMFHADAKILLVLSSWFSETFNVALEYGTLCRMLQIAAATGEPKLGQLIIQLMSKSGHTPRAADYACWVRASIAGNDFVSSVEALMEAQEQGLELLNETLAWEGGSELCEAMAYSLSRSVRRLDDTYFALVELVRRNVSVPRMTLNAVIMAAGRMGQIDRSFATFKEYKTLFNCDPDIYAYNALLFACASFRDSNVNTLLSIFQDMETAGVSPDAVSFSILLQSMADCQDLHSLGPVLDMIVENGFRVRSRPLRCVAVVAANQCNWACVEKIKTVLETQEGLIHNFVLLRLNQLQSADRLNQNLV